MDIDLECYRGRFEVVGEDMYTRIQPDLGIKVVWLLLISAGVVHE